MLNTAGRTDISIGISVPIAGGASEPIDDAGTSQTGRLALCGPGSPYCNR